MRTKLHHKITSCLTILAFALVLCAAAQDSLAYFTTTMAKGGYVLKMGNESKLKEDIDGLLKSIEIENTGETDCYVRVGIFYSTELGLHVTENKGSKLWEEKTDGYWYYESIVPPGGITEPLVVYIGIPPELKNLTDNFDVVVVQECTPVLYKEDGTPYADWNLASKEERTSADGEEE